MGLSDGIHDNPSLEELREKILVLVSQYKSIIDAEIARVVGVWEQLATFHLREFEQAGLIRGTCRMGSAWTGIRTTTAWEITQAGRNYLVSRGLLQ